jgi:tRNA(fMet)-specific endonuclease VapC
MTYLIDTDWVIDHLNHVERVTRRLEELAPGGLALSSISLAELYEGVFLFP